jgi:hypothetical protein
MGKKELLFTCGECNKEIEFGSEMDKYKGIKKCKKCDKKICLKCANFKHGWDYCKKCFITISGPKDIRSFFS